VPVLRWIFAAVGVAALAYIVIAFWPKPAVATSWDTIAADAQPLVVTEVLSGDTVVLVSDRPGPQVAAWGTVTARLIGVDAPNFGIVSQCYAEEAQARLASLLPEGSIAWVSTDVTATDDGGRYLMYVWTEDGRLTNQLLAVDGYVKTQDPGDNDALWPQIQRAGSQAAARFAGLWADCR